MSDTNVLQFADMQFRFKAKRTPFEKDRCEHKHLELDDNGQIVLCTDCGKQVDAYWALRHMTGRWQEHHRSFELQRQHLKQESEATLHLRAAKRVEDCWRSRTMLPSCPHCHRGIGPNDHFGSSRVNAEMEMRRREVERAK